MRTKVLVAVASALLAWGCSQPPPRAAAARAALDAIAAEAKTYAPDKYKAAAELASQLDAELRAQAGRFAAFRSYDRAGELAASLEAATGEVRRAIADERERLRKESDRTIADAKAALADARQLLEKIPAGQMPKDREPAWRTDLAQAETSLERTNRLLAGDQLGDALKSAKEVSTAVAELQAELQKAREDAAARVARGEVTIPRAVLVDGKPLAAGTYRLRLAREGPPLPGETGGAGRWVEFLRNGTVAGRGLAVVIPDAEIGKVAKSPPPRNAARVDWLRGGEYLRVWLNRNGMNYLVHMSI